MPNIFKKAIPLWPEGLEKEMNLMVGFRTILNHLRGKKTVFRIAASSLYRFFINGEFAGCGPARGPHRYYRVDEWDLSGRLISGCNILFIEIVGYNVNSYYLLDQPSFIQAEVISEDIVIAATHDTENDFEATIIEERIKKVQRYSFQRTFVEVYKMNGDSNKWRSDASFPMKTVQCSKVSNKELIPRSLPYSEFSLRIPIGTVSVGKLITDVKLEKYWRDGFFMDIRSDFKGYSEGELDVCLSNDLQKMIVSSRDSTFIPYSINEPIDIDEKTYNIFDFGTNLSGFIGVRVHCLKHTRLFFIFDEILIDQDIDFKRLTCINAVSFELEPGTYSLETFEPYTLKYLKLAMLFGKCKIESIYIREYVNPDSKGSFSSSSKVLNQIFDAGCETFKQNAVDTFMDCPSRERAGWLCDSFFTSRVEYDLCGKCDIERNFFENYLLPEKFEYLPKGMLPMCYPADHNNGVFIPNWALWFVLELEEYIVRSRDRELAEALKEKVYKLFEYFKGFINEDGLLEKLENWVFVEWSKANDYVQDVNYPSNMLYAGALSAAGRIYTDKCLMNQADQVRKIIRQQSFNGEFFIDNAVRENGLLRLTENTTETCQYYAFFFEVATQETHKVLWKRLIEKFGPSRKNTNEFPNVHISNAFIGNYLRLELLSRYGFTGSITKELEGYFSYMAEMTGTLWEHTNTFASCNHGFASHVIHVLYRDVLGIQIMDIKGKYVKMNFNDIELDWCKGEIPVGKESIRVEWRREGSKIYYKANLPEGFVLDIENAEVLCLIDEYGGQK